MEKPTKIVDVVAEDVRFPTSLELDGSDASHPDPDYSAVYVTLVTDLEEYKGFGISFTLGRGNEIVMHCVDALRFLVIDRNIQVRKMTIFVLFLRIDVFSIVSYFIIGHPSQYGKLGQDPSS